MANETHSRFDGLDQVNENHSCFEALEAFWRRKSLILKGFFGYNKSSSYANLILKKC